MMRSKKVDLHTHTNASDGELTPFELVNQARDKEISVLGITDHDTFNGVCKILAQAPSDIEVVPGAELSCRDGKRDIHLLVYYPDFANSELEKYLKKFRKIRRERIGKIVKKLKKLGIKITEEEIFSESGNETHSLGRPHIARVLVKKGFAKSIDNAFEMYLGTNAPAYVPKYKISPKEAIEIIKNSRGISCIAHPGQYYDLSYIIYLKKYGLRGVEVWHPDHSEKQTEELISLCEREELLKVGGSDFHGFNHDSKNIIGINTIPYEVVLKLKEEKEKL